ncbi:unnamed protein product [Vitrella brassicaformis CCMP3155]|uniref:Uncharacterized protein n=1 Tax=Vitrella brassicaformis (strain CCMP3155) TaxID=1169540 RepID=A0A0G4GKY2_VITBC|nr:unnamed protein product [Vitrella brassicaformis CCMP3155]|eukprot:CEM30681.1 unnamed protein product [Vitrella brassicaformis CCMP3155]
MAEERQKMNNEIDMVLRRWQPLTEAERTAIRQSAAGYKLAGDLEGGIKNHLKGMAKQQKDAAVAKILPGVILSS